MLDSSTEPKGSTHLHFLAHENVNGCQKAPFCIIMPTSGDKSFTLHKFTESGVGETTFLPTSQCSTERLPGGFVRVTVPKWLHDKQPYFFKHTFSELQLRLLDALKLPELQKQQLLHYSQQ